MEDFVEQKQEKRMAMPHFVIIPQMLASHMIPMIDFATLLAGHGALVSVVITPLNASRIKTTIDRLSTVHFIIVRFPSVEAGLPDGCENIDSLPSKGMVGNFLRSGKFFRHPIEQHLRQQTTTPPSCIVADIIYTWANDLARSFHIPHLFFNGWGAFAQLCSHKLRQHRGHELDTTDMEPFLLPGLPHRIELNRAQIPQFGGDEFKDLKEEMEAGEMAADGVLVNSFAELDPEYVDAYGAAIGKKVWTVGPVSLLHNNNNKVMDRGEKASIDEAKCLDWLDGQKPGSVIFASFGSMARLTPSQLAELGLGLEASNRPFIWVVKAGAKAADQTEDWLVKEGFEERTKDRGLVIRGWAPQVLILSHPSTGAFLTHCGWNSALEGVAAGVPLITWPMFAEQFLNEKLVVEVLGIGVGVGVKKPTLWYEEEKAGAQVSSPEVVVAIKRVMDGGEEGEEMRKRAREVGVKARRAMEEGGSSHNNFKLLIAYALQQDLN